MTTAYNSRISKEVTAANGMSGFTAGYNYFVINEVRGWDATITSNGQEYTLSTEELNDLLRTARSISSPSEPRKKTWAENITRNPESDTQRRSREYFESLKGVTV